MTACGRRSCTSRRRTRAPLADGFDVQPLTPDRIPDLATLFEEGGDPRWCWCAYFRVRGRSWSNSTPTENRELLSGLSARGSAATPSPGLVGYLGDRAVGWVSLGPREDYERLAYSNVLAPVDDRPVWSIVCFVVSRHHRRKGLAADLLRAAVDYARDRGAQTLEAYPIDTSAGRISSASAFHGTLSMFLDAGFEVVDVRHWNESSPARPIVRRELTPALAGG